MKGISSSLFAGILLALAVSVVQADAQQARSFVSNAIGNDANAPNCLRNAPCRTFQVAHNSTLALGEITVLDPGSYGSVTITKNISIINDGVGEAGVLVSGGGTGITISAGPTDAVTLRGLTIKGIGFGGGAGIVVNSGFSVGIENCVVRNLTGTAVGVVGSGIVFQPTLTGGVGHFDITNTFVTDNSFHGIWVKPNGSGGVMAVFNRVTSNGNGLDGFFVDPNNFSNPIQAAAESSVAAHNSNAGFELGPPKGQVGSNTLVVTRSVVAGNNHGFQSQGGGLLIVGGSNITGNAITWTGTVGSYGDNYSFGNLDHDPNAPAGWSRQ